MLRALGKLGFAIDREHEHIGMKRESSAATTLLIIPNHQRIEMATLLTACARTGIS